MAEVTREMILEYMQRKGGVVKNVDLVRHFRKFLQVDNSAAKDKARELFKERVNQVAYIKADNQGEKYLYLKVEYSRPPAGRPPSASLSQGDVRRPYLGSRSSVDSFTSSPPSLAHSALSQRESTHSILSARSSGDGDLSYSHSQQQRTPTHHNSRDLVHPPPSGRDSGQQLSSRRDSGHQPQSGWDSSSRYRSGQSSYLNGPSPSSPSPSSPSSSGRLQSSHSPSHSNIAPRGASSQTSSSPPPPTSHHALSTRKSLQSSSTSAAIENSFDSLLSKGGGGEKGGGGGGGSGSISGLGGNTSFASDIFGSIGGFWSDSAPATSNTFANSSNQQTAITTTTTTTTSNSASERQPVTANCRSPSERHQPTSSNIKSSSDTQRGGVTSTDSAGLRGGNTVYTQRPQGTSAYSRSQIAGGDYPEVSFHSYKTLSSSPPPSTSTFSPYSSQSSSQPLHAPPPKRGPAPSSGGRSDSLINSTSSKTSVSDGEAFLNQMTSELSSLGDFGNLFSSFGDFSMDKPTTSTFTSNLSNQSDQLGNKPSSSESPIMSSGRGGAGGGAGGGGGGGRVRDDGKFSISEQQQQQQNTSRGRSTTFNPPATSPRPPRPSPATHPVPQSSQSPMRVPRRHLGPPIDPPPPPPSSSPSSSPSTFMRRQGSNDSSHFPGAIEGSPRITVQRIDSGSSNGFTSPLMGDAPLGRSSGSSQGLPPLPPSAMTGASVDRRPNGAVANGAGLGVILRQDKSVSARTHSVVRRSRGNLERNTNLDTLTRASIMMTPPSVRRSIPAAGAAGVVALAVVGSREDLNVHSLSTQESGDEESLAAPSDEYDEIDPLEKEWMLACASANMEEIHTLVMRDPTLVNRRDFLHGYTALHWAAKLGRCDFMSAIIINGSFVDIKSNGGFTPLHLAAQGGYDNAIAMLVRDHGANVNARDNSGRKPIDMLHYNASEQTRALLSRKLIGMAARTMHKVEYLPSFSQPRNLSSLQNSWGSIPSVLDSTEEKTKKKTSPRLNVRKSFSFRNKHKLSVTSKDKESRRPRSHIPSFGESYDV